MEWEKYIPSRTALILGFGRNLKIRPADEGIMGGIEQVVLTPANIRNVGGAHVADIPFLDYSRPQSLISEGKISCSKGMYHFQFSVHYSSS